MLAYSGDSGERLLALPPGRWDESAREKPLVVKAAQLQCSDLVLAEDALKKLTEANASFLAEGRVAIVTQ